MRGLFVFFFPPTKTAIHFNHKCSDTEEQQKAYTPQIIYAKKGDRMPEMLYFLNLSTLLRLSFVLKGEKNKHLNNSTIGSKVAQSGASFRFPHV